MNRLKNLTERVVCPFDPVHVVERRRFQAHLIKCKRNLPKNHDFVQCQYWHLHYVRRSELNDHLESCEHKLEKEANLKMWNAEVQPAKFFQPTLKHNDVLPTIELESWEDATLSAPSFSSEKMLAKANYMTVPQGLSKSKRKEYRDKERERLREKEEEKIRCVAKGEKKNRVEAEPIPPQPRKPTENPVKHMSVGRIAAKFSLPKDHVEVSPEPSSVSSRNTSGAGNTSAIGRGRGLLGWSHITETEREFRFCNEDFPKL